MQSGSLLSAVRPGISLNAAQGTAGEDLLEKIRDTIHDCCEHYSRYHVLTKGAMEVMLGLPMEGQSVPDRELLRASDPDGRKAFY